MSDDQKEAIHELSQFYAKRIIAVLEREYYQKEIARLNRIIGYLKKALKEKNEVPLG